VGPVLGHVADGTPGIGKDDDEGSVQIPTRFNCGRGNRFGNADNPLIDDAFSKSLINASVIDIFLGLNTNLVHHSNAF